MKILIHTMYYLPDFGSAPVLMDELARSLAAAGHEVEVVTTLPRRRGADFRGLFYSRRVEGGVVVKRLWTNSAAHPLARLLAWNIYTVGALVNLLAARRADVLFLRTPPLQLGVPALFAKVLRGSKVLVNVQDIHPDLAIESGILKNPAGIRFARASSAGSMAWPTGSPSSATGSPATSAGKAFRSASWPCCRTGSTPASSSRDRKTIRWRGGSASTAGS